MIAMDQAREALIGTVLGFAGVAVLVAARCTSRPAARQDPTFVTGFRYCPAELRTRCVVLHSDGSARCLDCGTHITKTSTEDE